MVQTMIGNIKRALSAIVGIPGQLELIREAVASYDPQGNRARLREFENGLSDDIVERELRRVLEQERGWFRELQQQLAAEREAHAEDNERFNSVSRHAQELELKLAAALDKLDKLTRWRLQSQEACPVIDERVEYSLDGRQRYGVCRPVNLEQKNYWRHVPESLQALKESEGGDAT